MKKAIKSNIVFFLAAFIMLTLSSCAENEKGELEFTWLFWVILIVFVVGGIISYTRTQKEAEERGMSMEELLEEQKRELEKKQMMSGFEVEYLGGYPQWPNPCKVNFSIYQSRILLRKGSDICSISKEDIVAISNEKSGSRSVGKTAAGAIVGGVLTGGIGLIVGGALGARKTDTSEVYITYKYNGVELTINLKPGKNTDKVYSWINSVFA